MKTFFQFVVVLFIIFLFFSAVKELQKSVNAITVDMLRYAVNLTFDP